MTCSAIVIIAGHCQLLATQNRRWPK